MMQKKQIVTKNADETQKVASEIVTSLSEGTVITLYGDLGSGKTTFTQGIAKALGIEKHIQSPTFILMREYTVEHEHIHMLYHLDLYRIESYDSDELGLSDIFEDPNALVVIEWADKMKDTLPKERIDVYFETESEESRSILIKNRRKKV